METINPDGSPVLIEAVYWSHFVVHADECDTIAEAVRLLVSGEEWGDLSSVGVFVDGEPHLTDEWLNPHPPDEREAAKMRESYAQRYQPPSKSARLAIAPPLPPPSESS